MNNDELEKYLRSFIQCLEFYYFEVFRFHLIRYSGGTPRDIAEIITATEPIRYYQKNHIPDGYSWGLLSAAEKHFKWNPDHTFSYQNGMTKCTYSIQDATNYLITELQKILDDYLGKNNLEFMDLSLIFTGSYGHGFLIIPASTESFMLQSYDTEGVLRSCFQKGEAPHWWHPWLK